MTAPARSAAGAPAGSSPTREQAAEPAFDATELARLAEACRRQAALVEPAASPGPERLRQSAREAVGALLAKYPMLQSRNSGWGRFLLLDESQRLLAGEAMSPQALEVLESRWINATAAWDDRALGQAAAALRAYIEAQRRRRAALHGGQLNRPEDWLEIATLLESLNSLTPHQREQLGVKLGAQASLGQAPSLLSHIAAEVSWPNLVVNVPIAWLQRRMARHVNEAYAINGVYGGASARGQGMLSGEITCDVRPAARGADIIVLFTGTARSRSSATDRGVHVVSRTTTSFNAEKRFALDAYGLRARPATAVASSRLVYESVSAAGGPIRRRRGVEGAYGRRGRAERDAEADVRRSVVERLDSEGTAWAGRFNRALADVRNKAFSLKGAVFTVQARCSVDAIAWECRLASVNTIAITPARPTIGSNQGVTIYLAASALEQRANALLQGDASSGAQLHDALMGDGDGRTTPGGQDFSATFAANPCSVGLDGDQLTATMKMERFVADGASYPPLSVRLGYGVGVNDGAIVLQRVGEPRVRLNGSSAGGQRRSSGRELTLRLAVERKLDRTLARRVTWPEIKLPLGSRTEPLRASQATATNDWLVMSFDAPPGQRSAARPAAAATAVRRRASQ